MDSAQNLEAMMLDNMSDNNNCEISSPVPAQTTPLVGPSLTSQQQATAPLDDTFRVLRCLVQGDSTTFKVTVPLDNDVDDLKKLIHQEKDKGILRSVNASDLVLRKVDIDLGAQDEGSLGQLTITKDDEGVQRLTGWKVIRQYWPTQPARDRLHVIVKLPVAGGTVNDAGEKTEGNRVLNSDLRKEYQDIFIRVEEWGVFKRGDVERNNVRSTSAAPGFVNIFEEMLDTKPLLPPDADIASRYILDDKFRAAYFGTPEDESQEENKQPSRYAERLEVMHIGCIASENWEKCSKSPLGNTFKECLANAIFFFRLALHVPDDKVTTAQLGNTAWPFELVIQRKDTRPLAELRRYRPRSDLVISKSSLPRLLVEVNSTSVKDWPHDLVRMLLQGAAVVRFANKFVNAFSKKNFVLVAIYIYDDGRAIRHTLFQSPNDQAVCWTEKEFLLNNSVGRVEFVRQLYNLLHAPGESDDEDKDTREKIERLMKQISKHSNEFGLKSFHTQGTKKRARTGDNGGSGAPGAGGEGVTDCAELRAHGYEVEPDVIFDDRGIALEPLFKMPPHILTVYRPSDPTKGLIAKKLRKGSNELEIFKLLGTIQHKSNHIITLLDSFHTQSRSWVILPKMDTVADYLAFTPEELYSEVTRVCWGLIKGLGYLHENYIAHRDIKPDNLVVNQDFCLKIIDFDIAMQVKGEDEEVDDSCGTKGWMAPEVEKKLYSPIRADRWSCGRVLLYILDESRKEDKFLRAIAGKLKAHDPMQRPSLNEWRRWTATPTLAGKVVKITRIWQDTMEINGDNMNAKRQKLIESRTRGRG